MVNLYATVATEAITVPGVWHGDDGLPHTLEHLVFLGSKAYPFKGILDKMANRCLARGTNAWTDVDHTGMLQRSSNIFPNSAHSSSV